MWAPFEYQNRGLFFSFSDSTRVSVGYQQLSRQFLCSWAQNVAKWVMSLFLLSFFFESVRIEEAYEMTEKSYESIAILVF